MGSPWTAASRRTLPLVAGVVLTVCWRTGDGAAKGELRVPGKDAAGLSDRGAGTARCARSAWRPALPAVGWLARRTPGPQPAWRQARARHKSRGQGTDAGRRALRQVVAMGGKWRRPGRADAVRHL